MKCAECNLWWADYPDTPCSCHADSDWPAPCECEYEYDEQEEEEYKWVNEWGEATLINVPWIETDWSDPPKCSTCAHLGDLTADDVACCNCCKNYSFYEPRKEK